MTYSWYCEEFEEQKTFLTSNETQELAEIPVEVSNHMPTGLCASCDFADRCSLHSPKNTVLNCEHYQ